MYELLFINILRNMESEVQIRTVSIINGCIFFLLFIYALFHIDKLREFRYSEATHSRVFYIIQAVFLLIRTATFFIMFSYSKICPAQLDINTSDDKITGQSLLMQILHDFPDFLYLISIFFLLWIFVAAIKQGHISTSSHEMNKIKKIKILHWLEKNALWVLMGCIIVYVIIIYSICST